MTTEFPHIFSGASRIAALSAEKCILRIRADRWVPYPRASPTSLVEQPRMSLQTRRDYHEFLTRPILRQALTVGIGRIAENPINRAIDVLLSSDTDGQGRVKTRSDHGLSH